MSDWFYDPYSDNGEKFLLYKKNDFDFGNQENYEELMKKAIDKAVLLRDVFKKCL